MSNAPVGAAPNAVLARNHHFVPQCYLRGFAKLRQKPRLSVVDLKQKKYFETDPANVAVERDFNAIEVKGHRIDAFERGSSQFEGDLAESLRRIISNDGVMSGNDRTYLLNLAAMMAIKNPRMRRTMQQHHAEIYEKYIQLITNTEESFSDFHTKTGISNNKITRDDIIAFLEKKNFTLEFAPGFNLSIELKVFEPVLQMLATRKWSLLRARKGSNGFVTTDHPVCLRWVDPKLASRWRPPGFGLNRTEVLFPISRYLAWIGSFEHREVTLDVPESVVAQFNCSVMAFADRQVYGSSGDCTYHVPGDAKPRRLREATKDSRFAQTQPSRFKVKTRPPRFDANGLATPDQK